MSNVRRTAAIFGPRLINLCSHKLLFYSQPDLPYEFSAVLQTPETVSGLFYRVDCLPLSRDSLSLLFSSSGWSLDSI